MCIRMGLIAAERKNKRGRKGARIGSHRLLTINAKIVVLFGDNSERHEKGCGQWTKRTADTTQQEEGERMVTCPQD